VYCNAVKQGSDYTRRIGRAIIGRSILLRYEIAYDTPAQSQLRGNAIRLMLVWDKQPSGSPLTTPAPIFSDINTNQTIYSTLNLNQRERFKVMWDQIIPVDGNKYDAGGQLIGGAPRPTAGMVYKKFNVRTVFREDQGGDEAAEVMTNALLFVMVPQFDFAGHNRVLFNYRYRFEDE